MVHDDGTCICFLGKSFPTGLYAKPNQGFLCSRNENTTEAECLPNLQTSSTMQDTLQRSSEH